MIWLDSGFIIDFLYEQARQHDEAVRWMRHRPPAPVGTHPMVVFEVVRGTADTHDLEQTNAFVQTLTVPPFDRAGAMDAGQFDRSRHADGLALSPRDAIIAARAIEANATLVTKDRDFAAVGGLDVVFYDDE